MHYINQAVNALNIAIKRFLGTNTIYSYVKIRHKRNLLRHNNIDSGIFNNCSLLYTIYLSRTRVIGFL